MSIKVYFQCFLQKVNQWLNTPCNRHWIALFLCLAYFARYCVPLSQRIVLWDDFRDFTDAASSEFFSRHWLNTINFHFVPLLKLCYFLIFRAIPLPFLPTATSVWIILCVAFFSLSFIRLLHFYKISLLAGLTGLSFVLFNPMLSEVQIWFASSFCLVAVALTIEGILQWELAIRTNSAIHWILAVLLGFLAPLTWTMGYIVGIYYLIIALHERKKIKSLLPLGIALSIPLLSYPVMRGLSAVTIGYDAIEIKPLDALSLWRALTKIIGDGLILGSLGFWEVPRSGIKHAGRFLNLLTAIVMFGVVYLAVKREWRKQSCLILTAIVLGFGVPFLFRGSQTSYDGIKWYLRYFSTPVFGGALLISIFAQMAISKYHQAKLGCVFGMILMVLISFGDQMPEYYARGSLAQKINLRPVQQSQFKLLDKLFSIARQYGLGKEYLSRYFYFPVEGGFYSYNGMDLFTTGDELEENEVKPEAIRTLDAVFGEADVWKSYNMFSSAPELAVSILARPWDSTRASLDLITSTKPETFQITESSRNQIYELETPLLIYQMFWETALEGQGKQRIKFTFEFDTPQPVTRAVVISCPKSPCVFQLPMERLVWIPREPIKRVILDILNIDELKRPVKFTVLRAGVIPYPVYHQQTTSDGRLGTQETF